MALYEPEQKLVKFNGLLISNLKVKVDKGEGLFEMWSLTNSQPNVTNIAYKVIADSKQLSDVVDISKNIPWNGQSHTVEITIYTPDYETRHTSNNSDDAEIDKKDAEG